MNSFRFLYLLNNWCHCHCLRCSEKEEDEIPERVKKALVRSKKRKNKYKRRSSDSINLN